MIPSPTRQKHISAVYTARKARGPLCKHCGKALKNPRHNQLFCNEQERFAWWREQRASGKLHRCTCGQPHRPRKPQPQRARVRHVKKCVEGCPGCRG